MITIIGIVFVITLVLGIPVAVCLGMSAFFAILFTGDLSLRMIPERMLSSVNSFPLMAIPLFMIAGELMDSTGILDRLIAFCQSVVGHIRGGLAQITTLSGMILAGVSGTAVGDASALSATLIPAMKKEYGVDFAAGVVASAANIGPIIPPSAAMIVYAFMAGGTVSVAGLFLAGVVPGIMIGLGMMILSYVIAKKEKLSDCAATEHQPDLHQNERGLLGPHHARCRSGNALWGASARRRRQRRSRWPIPWFLGCLLPRN